MNLIVSTLLVAAAAAQELSQSPDVPPSPAGEAAGAVADLVATSAVQPGEAGVFRLRSGATVAGRFVSRDPHHDIVELADGSRLRLRAGDLVGRVAAAPAVTPSPPAPAPGPRAVRVFLRDGRTLEGELLPREDGRVAVKLAEGGSVDVARKDVRRMLFLADLLPDRGGPRDPGRGRYLLVPSAFMQRPREWTISASVVEPLAVHVGLTRWLSASVVATMPLTLETPSRAAGASASLLAGMELLPQLRAAGGVRGLVDRNGVMALLFGSLTYGTPAAHLTAYAGPPLPGAAQLGRFDEIVVGLAMTSRVNRFAAVVAEAWASPRTDRPAAVGALAARMLRDDLWCDVGAMLSTDDMAVAPWLALGWRGTWGRR